MKLWSLAMNESCKWKTLVHCVSHCLLLSTDHLFSQKPCVGLVEQARALSISKYLRHADEPVVCRIP